jgi:hypothetical protein
MVPSSEDYLKGRVLSERTPLSLARKHYLVIRRPASPDRFQPVHLKAAQDRKESLAVRNDRDQALAVD